MPFKSVSQLHKFYMLEKEGKLPKGTARAWIAETPKIEKLPQRAKKKK